MRANLNDKHMYAALITASVVAALTLAPALASAVSNIVSAGVSTSPNKLNANIITASTVAKDGTDGAFGYAVVTLNGLGGTGDSLMVATTHAGVLDSVAQSSASDPVWHTHYVKLVPATIPECTDTNGALGPLEVANLSKETPGSLTVFNNQIHFKAMPKSFTGTDALSNSQMTWNPGSQATLVASFTLHPVTDNGLHVCVENVSPVAANQ